jgi:hypothetical protein
MTTRVPRKLQLFHSTPCPCAANILATLLADCSYSYSLGDATLYLKTITRQTTTVQTCTPFFTYKQHDNVQARQNMKTYEEHTKPDQL